MNKQDIEFEIKRLRDVIVEPEQMGDPNNASSLVLDMFVYDAFKTYQHSSPEELKKHCTSLEDELLNIMPCKLNDIFQIMKLKTDLYIIGLILKND